MSLDHEFANRVISPETSVASEHTDVSDDHVRLHELRALFDVFLPDAKDDEVAAVAAIQDDLQTQQLRLEALLERKVIDPAEYAFAVNNEIAWCMRRSATVLGESRAKRLFGVDDMRQVVVVEPLRMTVATPASFALDVNAVTDAVLSRYAPAPKERKQVQRSVASIDPQSWRAISNDAWGRKEKYADLVSVIGAAEEAYHLGAIEASIERAHAVINVVSTFEHITDAPLYLTSWAHHIQGRGYEALTDWRRAAFSYECSLAFKMRMEEWLPPLPKFATEIKLGSVEVFQSPIEAASRLARVAEVLTVQPKLKRENARLYRNLLEDAKVALAEAYLAAGNVSSAIQHATSVAALARDLQDRVGQIRIIFVLYRAAAIAADEALRRVHEVIGAEQEQLVVHPRVASVLLHLSQASDGEADGQSALFQSAG